MYYFARFEEIKGHIFRFDTRIYLEEYDNNTQSLCVGAIVGKNPGSAKNRNLGVWSELDLNGDKMLPTIRKKFKQAFHQNAKMVPVNAYIRVWNLFYLCDPNLNEACKKINSFSMLPFCETEEFIYKPVWFAWGGNNSQLNLYKDRFINRNYPHSFFYCHQSKMVKGTAPSCDDFAKHPQGMPSDPVREFLTSVL